jgi:hypothetical protein
MRYFPVTLLTVLLAGAMIFAGCGPAEEPVVEKTPPAEMVEPETPAQAPEKAAEQPETPAEPAKPEPENEPPRAEAVTPPRNVWAAGKEGVALAGLDGGLYDPYLPSVIVKVQEALTARGLYRGEAHGYLDEETMLALGEFQKDHGLQVCGVPTPQTRRALFAVVPNVT